MRWQRDREPGVCLHFVLTQCMDCTTTRRFPQDFLHSRGIVHGRLHPRNVMLGKHGGRWRAFLADTGPLACGAPLPTDGARHFIAPELRVALGKSTPTEKKGIVANAVDVTRSFVASEGKADSRPALGWSWEERLTSG